MSALDRSNVVPPAVEQQLRAVRRQLLLSLAKAAAFLGLASLLGVMLLAMLIDFLASPVDQRLRVTMTLVALGTVAVVAVRYGLLPLIVRRPLSSVAWDVDRTTPQLGERLTTVTQLGESKDAPEIRGAESLIRKISQETSELSHMISAEKVLPRRQVRRLAIAAGAAGAVLGLALLLNWRDTAVLIGRFWAPTSSLALTRITATPGDADVGRLEPVVLAATIEGRLRDRVDLVLRNAQGERTVAMAALGDGRHEYGIDAVQETFQYRIRSGDGVTPWHTISVLERPDLARAQLRIVHPAYTRRSDDVRNALPRTLSVLQGSRLELELLPNKPLARLELRGQDRQTELLQAGEDGRFRQSRILDESLSFKVVLTDERGLTNHEPPTVDLIVQADRPPTVQIHSPEERIAVPPDEVVEVAYEASDDVGLARLELVVTTRDEAGRTQTQVTPIDPEKTADLPEALRGTVALDLKPFDLKSGAELVYSIRATDARLAEGSDTRRIEPGGVEGRDSQTAERKEGSSPGGTTRPVELAARQNSPATQPVDSAHAAGEESGSEFATTLPSQSESAQNDPQENQPDIGESADAAEQAQREFADSLIEANAEGARPRDENASGDPLDSPPVELTMRRMPGNPPQASSQSQTIEVDEWAPTQATQRRKKLEIEIERYVKKLDAALAEAQQNVAATRKHLEATAGWDDAQDARLSLASEKLADATDIVIELKGRSTGTPYAFMGLQLEDVQITHIQPASSHTLAAIGPADDLAPKSKDLEQSAYHIARARDRLANLMKEYEQVRKDLDMSDKLARFKKMHQIIIEDAMALLGQSKPGLNPREPGEPMELSDETVQKLKEREEKLKKLMEELAKYLAEDPNMLRRMMAQWRKQGDTIRDQLTLLAQRQSAQLARTGAWNDHMQADREMVKSSFLSQYAQEQTEIAGLTGELSDNLVTWLPKEIKPDEPAVVQAQTLGKEAALDAVAASSALVAGQIDAGLEQAVQSVGQLNELEQTLYVIEALDPSNPRLGHYLYKRAEEIDRIRTRHIGLLTKIRAVRAGNYAEAGGVDQTALLADTVHFNEKLSALEPMIAGSYPQSVLESMRELRGIMEEQVVGDQLRAREGFARSALATARAAQADAVSHFAQAETKFDQLLTAMEDEFDNAPPITKVPEAMTLEELLKLLEYECEVCEKLGLAGRPLNVILATDWFMPESGLGGGGGSGQGAAQGAGTASGIAAMQMQQLQQQAQGRAQSRAAGLSRDLQTQRLRKAQDLPGTDRDWDTLTSQLQKELKQVRSGSVPEEYRQAIDEYLQIVADEATDAATKAPSE